MKKALFLDRDGVVNIDFGYVHKKENFIFREGIFQICKEAKKNNFLIFVVTNQAGIAKNKFTIKEFIKISNFMLEKFNDEGINISWIYFCPYHPQALNKIFRQDSFERKPKPGMILRAKKEFNLNIKKGIMIGDKFIDELAAKNAGILSYIDSNKKDWVRNSLELLRS